MDWPQPPEDPGQGAPPPKRLTALWVALASVVLAALLGGLWLWVTTPGVPVATPRVAEVVDAGVPDAGVAVSIADGNARLLSLAGGLSSLPEFSKWLAADDLIRRLTAAVNLVADGESPRPVLGFIEVLGPYPVVESAAKGAKAMKPRRPPRFKKGQKPPPVRMGPFFVTPDSYARYDGAARIVESIDAAAAGKAFTVLRPFFDAAYAEIGRPGKTFDQVLTAALDRLLGVQFPSGPLELQLSGAVYKYKDPALEGLSAAEKHLLRMGPKNGATVQTSLRAFAIAASLTVTPAH